MPYKDPIKLKNFQRLYRLKNKKRLKEYKRKHYMENIDHYKKRSQIYQINNLSKITKYQKLWRKLNPEKMKNRYLRQKRIGATYAIRKVQTAIRQGLLPSLSDKNIKCSLCNDRAIHYDHRDYNKPLKVKPVCRKCNFKLGHAKEKINVN